HTTTATHPPSPPTRRSPDLRSRNESASRVRPCIILGIILGRTGDDRSAGSAHVPAVHRSPAGTGTRLYREILSNTIRPNSSGRCSTVACMSHLARTLVFDRAAHRHT